MQQRQGCVEAVTILIRSAAAVPSIFMDTFAATTLAEREEDSHFPGSMIPSMFDTLTACSYTIGDLVKDLKRAFTMSG